MVHADKGLVGAPRRTLGESDADHQRANQTRRNRGAYGVEVGPGELRQAKVGRRNIEALVAQAADGLDVLAAGYLGHHTAEARMEIDLRGNHIGDQVSIAIDDSGGGFVARAFDGYDKRPLNGCRGCFGFIVHLKLHAADVMRGYGQGAFHHHSVCRVVIVTRAHPHLGQAGSTVERLGAGVIGANLQHARFSAEVARIARNARKQLARNATTAILGVYAYAQNLKGVTCKQTTRVADKLCRAHRIGRSGSLCPAASSLPFAKAAHHK